MLTRLSGPSLEKFDSLKPVDYWNFSGRSWRCSWW